MMTVTKLVLTADTKIVPVETPGQKDVWWNGHIPPNMASVTVRCTQSAIYTAQHKTNMVGD